MSKFRSSVGAALCAGLLTSSCGAQNPVPSPIAAPVSVNAAGKPNLIMILADDLGFSDLSCYGGEIDTPNLDKLAAGGLQFSHYRTSAMCVTTRASLLTGMEFNMAGKQPMNRGIPLARALRNGGYKTIISGKWHLADNPTDKHFGFSDYFGFLGGQTDCFNGGPDWVKDGKPFTNFDGDFYATDDLTDYALEKIEDSVDKKQPFFLYLSYNAPHVPLQAPEAEVRKYLDRGTYAKGWDPIRRARTAALIKRGLVDASTPVTAPIGADVEPWALLSPAQQENEELKQATYAAMIDRLDQNVGRLVADLEKRGQLDNTMIVFASDNGADYEGIPAKRGTIPWDRTATGAHAHLTGSNGWAYANNAPFRLYKHSATEGGLAAPLLVRWPRGIKVPAGTIVNQDVRLWDIYPTMLEAAGLTYNPENEANVRPLMGKTLSPIFADAAAPGHDGFISSFMFSRSLIRGKWKLAGFVDSPWQLFDLKNDRTERNDLASKEPKVLAEMVAKWDAYVAKAGNVEPSWNPRVTDEKKYWLDQRKNSLIAEATPKFSDPNVALDTLITLKFAGDIEFKNAKGVGMNGRLHLMKYGQQEPVWSIDPTPANLIDVRTLQLKNPRLQPNSHYYIVWDKNLVRVNTGKAIQPLPPMQNGPFAYRFATGTVSDSVHSPPVAPVTTAQANVESHIFKTVGARELKLTAMKPKNWKQGDMRPAIVFFHGGSWIGGKPVQFDVHSQHYAELGIVSIQPEYRLLDAKGNEPPEVCIQDAKSAMRWVRAHASELGIDPQRIAAAGGSAGGHLAAATAFISAINDPQDDMKVSPKPQALILFNPVSDNGPVGGYGAERIGARYMEFSPAHNVTPNAPPTIIFLGTKDNLIPVATAKRFQDALLQAGAKAELKLFPDKGHSFFNVEPDRGETLRATDAFLKSLHWIE